MNKLIQIGKMVNLNDGRKGKVIGRLASGEYILTSGKGGQISYFKADAVAKEDKQCQKT